MNSDSMSNIAVISDIHGNIDALKAAYSDIQSQGIDEVYCTGDISDEKGAKTGEVIDFFIKHSVTAVGGNVDFYLGDWLLDLMHNPQQLFVEAGLTPAQANYIASLPSIRWLDSALFVHGAPPDYSNKLVEELDVQSLQQFFLQTGCQVCFVGHSHRLQLFVVSSKGVVRESMDKEVALLPGHGYIINVGSISLARDHDSRPKYVVWDRKRNVVFPRIVTK